MTPQRVSVELAADWWGGSATELQDHVVAALEDVGARRDGDSLTVRMAPNAQRRLRREAQMIRNRAQIVRNAGTLDRMSTQVVDVRGWVVRVRSDIRHSKAVAHIA